MQVVITGPLVGTDRAAVISFLRAEGYAQSIHVADCIYAAWSGSEVVGAVRLAPEHGVTVLRGMRVRSDLRRKCIGSSLLNRLAEVLGEQNCYCIPYSWLVGFYGQIGFEVARPNQVPAFLAERYADYVQRGLDVAVMVRK